MVVWDELNQMRKAGDHISVVGVVAGVGEGGILIPLDENLHGHLMSHCTLS